jgi:ATP-dependent Lhr-like helicase
MNLPASGSDPNSSSFHLLDERIRRWVWENGWTELRDAQERAIPPILGGVQDVIIAAATASGKTEAAFLPILTRLLGTPGGLVLAVCPLKALINDQWERLEPLCKRLEVPITPWHGDIFGSRKQRFLKAPGGCLFITPESLEALLMTRGHALSGLFPGLLYVVIDELHSFMGRERGRQLQSLLHRIEVSLGRKVQRIGLSATLGDMGLAEQFLRPRAARPVLTIVSRDSGQELRVLVKGYRKAIPAITGEKDTDSEPTCESAIAKHLFKTFRGRNNLVFPNSRNRVELLADMLRRMSEEACVPNEFWPHHGSLSKELREETEAALKFGDRPATAICTSTLELGIDIGSVQRIGQVGPAPSVASLRQRLGRSGRRKGDPAILFCYDIEPECVADSQPSDLLREGLVQTIAQIRLLVRGWYEPPAAGGLDLSTLIQQLLSVVVQSGGLTAARAWRILCENGPFPQITQQDFATLLREIGRRGILMQDSSGLLLLSPKGESLTGHHSFYAAFASGEEFQLLTAGKRLGALPVSSPLEPGSHIIFAGRRWQVESLDMERKTILVFPAKGGRPPVFEGGSASVADGVRQEMRQVLAESSPVPFLDPFAQELLEEARGYFQHLGLDQRPVLEGEDTARIFPWVGDVTMNSLAMLFRHWGLNARNEGLCILVTHFGDHSLPRLLFDMSSRPLPDPATLVASVLNKQQQKWDWLLPEELLRRNYASHNLDVEAAMAALKRVLDEAPQCGQR